MDNLSHAQLAILQKKMKEANEQRYLEQSRNRLSKIISTKIKTAFIGAIDAIEKNLGFLWEEHEQGGEAAKMWEIYQKMRTEILNNGNNQMRAAQNEISNNMVKWNRYHVDIVVKDRSQNNE